MMSSKNLLWPDCEFGYRPIVVTVLLYLSTISTASSGPNYRDSVTPATRTACGELPSVQHGVNGDQERLACCPGWLLQEGKCINGVRASTRACRDSACPMGRVCSPFGGSILCICPKGRRGAHCGQNCPPGLYGWGCRKRCKCRFGEPCDPVSGACDDDDGDDGMDGSSTTVSNQIGNNTTGLCGCGLRGAIGCACNAKTNRCECPGYAVALVVVSVVTWASVGSVFFGYYLMRKGYVDPILVHLGRYRRKFNEVEEGGGDSGFNTDIDQPGATVSWWDYPPPVSERSSGEYPLLTPITIPADLLNISSYVTRISRDSLPRSTSHSSEEEGDYDVGEDTEGEEEEDEGEGEEYEQPNYLNIPEFQVEQESDGEEYSQPYEHFDQLSRQNSVHSDYEINTRVNYSHDPSVMKRTWTGPEERICDENSYVNESVLKWKRRFATRRTILSRRQQRSFTRNRCPVAPLSASCSDVLAVSAASKPPIIPTRTTNLTEKQQKRKPTVKPKPEFIKLKMLMDIQKRKRRASYGRTREVKSCDSCLAGHDKRQMSFSDLDSIKGTNSSEDAGRQSNYDRIRNNRLRHLRAALLKKGISVPESDSHTDRRHLLGRSADDRHPRDEMGGPCNHPDDPIYENNMVMKHTRRKSRLHSLNSMT